MSDTQIHRPVGMEDTERKESSVTKACTKENEKTNNKKLAANPTCKKSKHENDSRFKFGRKRSQSFITGNGKFIPPYKRRKKESIIPPTKFLLGGNIRDPLNLNSLQDEEINKAMNAVTPKSSPLPTPHHRKGEIEVIIPPNLRDPLNLISCADDAEYEQQLVSPTKKGRKSRNRKKKRNSSSGGSTKDDSMENCVSGGTEMAAAVDENQDTEKDVVIESAAQCVPDSENNELKEPTGTLDTSKEKKIRKSLDETGKDNKKNRKVDHTKDKIVSPVIPQPGAWKRPPPYAHRVNSNPSGTTCRRPSGNQQKKTGNDARPNFREKDAKFQYGNYTRYYGYRNPMHEEDLRLKCFMQRPELFQDKDVLDIGCNIGHVTLMVARDLGARSVVGIDIDRKLIDIARKNVRHYVHCAESPPGDRIASEGPPNRFFPISMPILYGPVDVPGFTKGESPSVRKKFPHNVSFVQGNYVVESDALLGIEQPQFDVILCLSVTKWIHLNWGDAGLRQAFKRMFVQLRPGGHLILEAQSWDSYKRKKGLTEAIFRNFKSIEFLPHKFTQYLLSSEVGFTKCEVIGTPFHRSRGFQRPIQLFTKCENSPGHSLRSTGTTPSHHMGPNRTRIPVYASATTLNEEPGEEKTMETDKHSLEPEQCTPSSQASSPHDCIGKSATTAEVCVHGAESVDSSSSVADTVGSQMELSMDAEVSKENTAPVQTISSENSNCTQTGDNSNRSNDSSNNATASSSSSSSGSSGSSSSPCSTSDVEHESTKAR